MYDLIIEGKKRSVFDDRPIISLSKKLGIMLIEGWPGKFSENQFKKITDWLEDYKSNIEKPLSIEGVVPFALPQSELKYTEYYSTAEDHFGPLNDLLLKLSNFDCKILKEDFTGAVPNFYGSMSQEFIKFEGECFLSNTLNYFVPVFSWTELFLKKQPKKIRLEFWLSYFNTSSSRKFYEFITILEKYQKDTNAEIKVFWYYLSDNFGMQEEGELFKEDSPLDFELIEVDDRQWEDMNKN